MVNFDLSNEICVVVGLGNPGKEYENTKHNIGFMVVDDLLSHLSGSFKQISGCQGICVSKQVMGRKMFFLKPLTYMNLSGTSVASLCRKNKINPKQVLVVYDDMDLPFGKIRLKVSGGSGGHNGINSIINELQTNNFPRLRIGIGRVAGHETVTHVLSEFSKEDENILSKLLEISGNAVKLSVRRGIKTAMNEYNGHPLITDIEEENSEKNQNSK
jgi:peptidyl-tRNA hydrolase, PTH1 family